MQKISLSDIQAATKIADYEKAEELLKVFLGRIFGFEIGSVKVRQDALSLNSVNGFISLETPEEKAGQSRLFFKFHQEEDEDKGIEEYYNSKLLEEAGYPVETPLYASTGVGEQVLVYKVKTSERMADACKAVEDGLSYEADEIIKAQEKLDRDVCQRYLSSLHNADKSLLEKESILQLFYWRIVDGQERKFPGGRFKNFYVDKTFEFPNGISLSYEQLSLMKWKVNGVLYKETLQQAFEKAHELLSPEAHLFLSDKKYPAVVAHGDAHNGNVWFNREENRSWLSMFDPAFAGKNIPALLAEIKPTFHNIYAHPDWLYNPSEADEKLEISAQVKDGTIEVNHNWDLSDLRKAFLVSKTRHLWIPLVSKLKAEELLPDNWKDYMRAALFCCPSLVLNLRANAGSATNSHTKKTSLLGFCVCMALSSEPEQGKDSVSEFFSHIENALRG